MRKAISVMFPDINDRRWNRHGKLPWLRGTQQHRPFQLTMRPLMAQVDFLFTVVRHPLDLYVSWWRTIYPAWETYHSVKKTATKGKHWYAWREAENCWSGDFNQFVMNMVRTQPGFFSRMFELFVGPEGGEVCAYVGHTDTLVDDFKEIMRILGYGPRLKECWDDILALGIVQHENAVPTDNKPEWSEQARRAAEISERLGIKRFFSPQTQNRRKYAELSSTIDTRHCRRTTKSYFWNNGCPFDMEKENPRFWG